jgi:hypothetical protein
MSQDDPASKLRPAGPGQMSAGFRQMSEDERRRKILLTHKHFRFGIAILAIAFAIGLPLWVSFYEGIPRQTSLSAYYHATNNSRDIFVGVLVAIGVALYAYKGEFNYENLLLNIASVGAIGVAFFPMDKGGDCSETPGGFSMHGGFAALLFIVMTAICVRYAFKKPEGQPEGQDAHVSRWRIFGYGVCASAMIISVLLGVSYFYFVSPSLKSSLCTHSIILWIEVLGVLGFAAFWFLRTLELDIAPAVKAAVSKMVSQAPDRSGRGSDRNDSDPAGGAAPV